jgi:hypothetical protein
MKVLSESCKDVNMVFHAVDYQDCPAFVANCAPEIIVKSWPYAIG